MFIGSPPGQRAAVEEAVAELEAAAAELEAAADVDSVVDADVDVGDADSAACVCRVAAVCMPAAASPCPSAVNGGRGGGDGCVGAAVGDNVEGEVLWLTQLSADSPAPELELRRSGMETQTPTDRGSEEKTERRKRRKNKIRAFLYILLLKLQCIYSNSVDTLFRGYVIQDLGINPSNTK